MNLKYLILMAIPCMVLGSSARADLSSFEKISCRRVLDGTSKHFVEISLERQYVGSYEVFIKKGTQDAPKRSLIKTVRCESPNPDDALDKRLVGCTTPLHASPEPQGLYYFAIAQNTLVTIGSPTLSTPGQPRESKEFVVTVYTPDLLAVDARTEYRFRPKECKIFE